MLLKNSWNLNNTSMWAQYENFWRSKCKKFIVNHKKVINTRNPNIEEAIELWRRSNDFTHNAERVF